MKILSEKARKSAKNENSGTEVPLFSNLYINP